MKRFVLVFLIVCMMCFQSGCVQSNDENMVSTTNGRFMQVQNEQDLYYDIDTKIVYVMFIRSEGRQSATGYMSPYYANNGLPYIYNTETNSLEENSWSKISGLENWFKH